MQSEDRKQWLDLLDERLSADDVRELVFDLSLDWDNLGHAETKRGRLRALIEYHERRGSLDPLLSAIVDRRPDILPVAPTFQSAAAQARKPAPHWPRSLTHSGEDWLDFVTIVANLVALIRLAQGDTGWTILLLLVAALTGGLRSRAVSRSTLWVDPRWRPWAHLILFGIPCTLIFIILGYHVYLRRQIIVYLVALPLVGLALIVVYGLLRRSRPF